MSKAQDARVPGNLIFLLRALFGVNARAEIFAWLLVHGSGNPTAIARDTGYFFKSVQFTLNKLDRIREIHADTACRFSASSINSLRAS